MDYERYKKYFLARTFWFRYVGIALVIVGAAMFVLGYMNYMFFVLPAGAVLAVAGGVIGWAPSAGRAGEKEVLAAVDRMTEGAVDKALDKTGLRYKIADNMPPQKVTGYVFDPENPYIRRGDDDHWRTSDCVCSVLIFTKIGICAVSERFSLIEESTPEMTRRELLFTDFDGAHFDTEEHKIAYGKKVETARFSRLTFTLGDAAVFSIPAEKTANLEIMINDMLHHREAALRAQNR